MTSLKRFRRALDGPFGVSGVTAELGRLLGSDLRAVAPLLRTLPTRSETYPRPTPGGEGCSRRVVLRDGGQFVAVCDPKRLCRVLVERLPVKGTPSAIGVDDSLWSIGCVRPQTDQKQIFVVPRGGQPSVERGVSQLLAFSNHLGLH